MCTKVSQNICLFYKATRREVFLWKINVYFQKINRWRDLVFFPFLPQKHVLRTEGRVIVTGECISHPNTHTHIHTPVSSLFSAIKSVNVASFRCQLLSSPRRSSLAWPPCENLRPFGLLVGSLLPLVLLLVGTAVTNVLDAKICLPLLSILGRSQWPRCLGRRIAAACLAEIVGSNPTGGLDVLFC